MTLEHLGICCQEFIRLWLPYLNIDDYPDILSFPEKCYTGDDTRMSKLTPRQRHKGWVNITSIAEVQSDSTSEIKGGLSIDG